MNLAGKFIVIDGPDGCGKGTQIERLGAWIEREGARWTRAKDPGGTEIGDRIRRVLLGYDLSEMAPRCEALLFMASRAQLVEQVVRPAIEAGRTVIGDRFISATCAYQVAAGFPRDEVIALGRLAVGDLWPDLTLVLDVPPEIGFARTGRTPQRVASAKRAASGELDQIALFDDARVDAMERRPLDYHRRVRENFLRLPQFYPRAVEIVDGARAPDEVFENLTEALGRAFP